MKINIDYKKIGKLMRASSEFSTEDRSRGYWTWEAKSLLKNSGILKQIQDLESQLDTERENAKALMANLTERNLYYGDKILRLESELRLTK